MATNGITKSFSLLTHSLGDNGKAFLDYSIANNNLCFELPIISIGGEKSFSLSLIYNHSSLDTSVGNPFLGGYRLSIHSQFAKSAAVDSDNRPLYLDRTGFDGVVTRYPYDSDRECYCRDHSPEELRLGVDGSSNETVCLKIPGEGEYLYRLDGKFPVSFSPESPSLASFSVSLNSYQNISSISLEGGRILVFGYASTNGVRRISSISERYVGSTTKLQTVVFAYSNSTSGYIQKISYYRGPSSGVGIKPSKVTEVVLGDNGIFRIRDGLRGISYSYRYDSQSGVFDRFYSSDDQHNQTGTAFTAIAPYSNLGMVQLIDPRNRKTSYYFVGKYVCFSFDQKGNAVSQKYDPTNDNLLYVSGRTNLRYSATVNANPILQNGFFTNGLNHWEYSQGSILEQCSDLPFSTGTTLLSAKTQSISQTAPCFGLPGEPISVFALLCGITSSGSPTLSVQLFDLSGECIASASEIGVHQGYEHRPELISLSLCPDHAYASVQVTVTGNNGAMIYVKSVQVRKVGPAFVASYGDRGELVAWRSSDRENKAIIDSQTQRILVGSGSDGVCLMSYQSSSSSQPVSVRSDWGVRTDAAYGSNGLKSLNLTRLPDEPSAGQLAQSFQYDSDGHNLLIAKTAYGLTQNVAFDMYERPYQISVPNWQKIERNYDSHCRAMPISSTFGWTSSTARVVSMSYSSSFSSLLSSSQEGIDSSFSYNSLFDVTDLLIDSEAICHRAYDFGSSDRYLLSQEQCGGSSSGQSSSFSHDFYERVTSVSICGDASAPESLAYTYDLFDGVLNDGTNSYEYRDDGSLAKQIEGTFRIAYESYRGCSCETIEDDASTSRSLFYVDASQSLPYSRLNVAYAPLFEDGLSACLLLSSYDTLGEGEDDSELTRHPLTMRGVNVSLPATYLWDVQASDGILTIAASDGHKYPHYILPAGARAVSPPKCESVGAWVKLSQNYDYSGATILGLGLNKLLSSHLTHLLFRMGSFGDTLEFVYAPDLSPGVLPQSSYVIRDSIPFSFDEWHYLSIRAFFSPMTIGSTVQNRISRISIRVDGQVFNYDYGSSSSGSVQWEPASDDQIHYAFLGRIGSEPNSGSPGQLFGFWCGMEGKALSDERELSVFESGRAALFGTQAHPTSSLCSYDRAGTIQSSFLDVIPLNGSFSGIRGGELFQCTNSVRIGNSPSPFRFDQVENRCRYYANGNRLSYRFSSEAHSVSFSFKMDPMVGVSLRSIFEVSFGISSISLFVSGSSLFLSIDAGEPQLIGSLSSGGEHRLLWSYHRMIVPNAHKISFSIYIDGSIVQLAQASVTDGAFPSNYVCSFGLNQSLSIYSPMYGYLDAIATSSLESSGSGAGSVDFTSLFNRVSTAEESNPIAGLIQRKTLCNSISFVSNFTPRVVSGSLLPEAITDETHKAGSATVYQATYSYDALGRMTQSGDDALSYDEFSRLSRWQRGNQYDYGYEYDGPCLRYVRSTATQSILHQLSYDGYRLINYDNDQIQYKSDSPFLISSVGTYDNAGNLIQGRRFSYQGGILTSVETVGATNNQTISFEYYPSGLRSAKHVPLSGVKHLYRWDGSSLCTEDIVSATNSSLIHRIRYFYSPSGVPLYLELDGERYFYVVDSLGSVVRILNSIGAPVVYYDYDPWGNPLPGIDISGVGLSELNSLRYRSYIYDQETGFYYCRSRYYVPQWMRWLTPDSIDYLDPASLDGMNPYLYCHHNPIAYSDPTGYLAITTTVMLIIGICVGAAIGATSNVISQYISNGGWNNFSWASLAWNTLIGAASGALGMSALGSGAMVIANCALSALGSIGNHLIAGDSFSSRKTWGDIAISTAAGFIAGLLGGPGAMHSSRMAAVRAASGVVKASTSYLNVLSKATSGGYSTLRGAHIALTITKNNLLREWDQAFTMFVVEPAFESLAVSAITSIGSAFASGARWYGYGC